MSILERPSIWQRIVGGWRTWGPNSGGTLSYEDAESLYSGVNQNTALTLSAVRACMHLRAESIASMPLHLRDRNKNILRDHDLYNIIHLSPNADQTAAEFWSLMTAMEDMHGDAIAVIQRNQRNKVVSLMPTDAELGFSIGERKSGRRMYTIDGEDFPDTNILHFRGFSLNPLCGSSRLGVGRQILSAQLSANEAAMRAFKQGLKVGGFFKVDQNLTDDQLPKWQRRLAEFSRSENSGKFLTLMKGMEPIAGANFRVKPVDAELLQSRYFGIEECCRLFNTPPPLIGHTDKASSWASSLETLNLFYLTYGIVPTITRREQRLAKVLLSPEERALGYEWKHTVDGLLRADLKTRTEFYASGLQNGYLNANEVRDMEERGTIPGGDEYRVQVNMTGTSNNGTTGQGKKP